MENIEPIEVNGDEDLDLERQVRTRERETDCLRDIRGERLKKEI